VMSPEWVRAANSLALTDRWITPFFRLSQKLPRRKYFAAFLQPYKPVSTVSATGWAWISMNCPT
ncbi:MAG: hypothetical protein IKZ31_03230, partial [Lentisphaeria bacterium]|nr:hypothetical protein [Lentisphaeria bacterium]